MIPKNKEGETMVIQDLDELLRQTFDDNLIVKDYEVKHFLSLGDNFGGSIFKVIAKILQAKDRPIENLHLVGKTIIMGITYFDWDILFKREIFMYTDVVPLYESVERASRSDSMSTIARYFPRMYGHRVSLDSTAKKVDADAIFLLEDLLVQGYYFLDKKIVSGDVKRRDSIGEIELQEIELAPDSGGGESLRSASTDDVGKSLKKDDEICAVQTVDLVAGCPKPVVPAKVTDPSSDCEAIIRVPSPTPSGTSSVTNMGQRPSSISRLRPKISLTWVLRAGQHQQHDQQQEQHSHQVHYHSKEQQCHLQQQEPNRRDPERQRHSLRNSNNDKNNNSSTSRKSKASRHTSPPAKLNNQHQIVVELHREKDSNFETAKEREEKDRIFRRSIKSVKSVKSVKSAKSVKSVKSAKSVKNSDIIRCKERDKENLDRIETHERNAATIQRLERSDKIEQVVEKDDPDAIHVENVAEKKIDKDCQIIRESKESMEKVKRAISEPNLMNRESNCAASGREKHRHRRTKRGHRPKTPSTFGIEIADLDAFLTKASIERPANVSVVLSQSSTLYQTAGGHQAELALPLGTVLNAVFKNQAWLYVQTAHGHEGYVGCEACIPLGIPSPPRDSCSSAGPQGTSSSSSSGVRQRASPPCWEDSTDLFPRPLGNQTDPDRIRDTRSEYGIGGRRSRLCSSSAGSCSSGSRSTSSSLTQQQQHHHRAQSRTSVEIHRHQQQGPETTRGLGDRLFLRASSASPRQRLLLVRDDYEAESSDALTVTQGQLIYLVATAEYGTVAGPDDDDGARSNSRGPDWLWVRDRQGREGLVPTRVAARALL